MSTSRRYVASNSFNKSRAGPGHVSATLRVILNLFDFCSKCLFWIFPVYDSEAFYAAYCRSSNVSCKELTANSKSTTRLDEKRFH